MDNPRFKHNLAGQVIGEIEYAEPYQFTFVYPDNRRNVFNNIVRFVAMRTGCYVLFNQDGTSFVIRPLHEYIIEKPQPGPDLWPGSEGEEE